MDRFKFRVWNEFVMLTHEDLMITAKELCEEAGKSGEYENCILIPNHKDLKVMQYTGLKDKNEKEIYECDIVKVSGMCEAIGVVVFNNCEFCIKEKLWYSKKPIYRNLKTKGNYDDGKCSFDFKQTFEVIGNIYQDEKLLENK